MQITESPRAPRAAPEVPRAGSGADFRLRGAGGRVGFVGGPAGRAAGGPCAGRVLSSRRWAPGEWRVSGRGRGRKGRADGVTAARPARVSRILGLCKPVSAAVTADRGAAVRPVAPASLAEECHVGKYPVPLAQFLSQFPFSAGHPSSRRASSFSVCVAVLCPAILCGALGVEVRGQVRVAQLFCSKPASSPWSPRELSR